MIGVEIKRLKNNVALLTIREIDDSEILSTKVIRIRPTGEIEFVATRGPE